MKVVKLNLIVVAAVMAITVLPSCRKEAVKPPVVQEDPKEEEVSMLGYWEGTYSFGDGGLNLYFAIEIISDTELTIVNSDKEVLGTGTWTVTENVFTAHYAYEQSPEEVYSLAAKFDQEARTLSGSWGEGLSTDNGNFYLEQQ